MSRRHRQRPIRARRERDLIVVAAAIDRHDLALNARLAEFPESDAPLTTGQIPHRLLGERDSDKDSGEADE
jgi:hypothetical protein